MNTPEKIYVYIPDDDIVGTASTQKGFPHQFVTEEYTQTDAFIKKAREFLSKESNIPLWEGYNDTFGCDTRKLVENFINYMKEE